eukprot:CAMPEP_0176478336 /NCGR_PEP_ID=MMETSP0200_2-20121128/1130_1 /TAXON_ID=947934 /ORGANISM="Chaetoceros sp., Strain GSL56" /LENGTH=318 /DNA_ID=CAMNT_0017874263 /DNA_START=123 /DNA_END=1079 /DNA_ORIENTATION=+
MNLFKRTKGSSNSANANGQRRTKSNAHYVAAPSTPVSKSSKIHHAYDNQISPDSTKSPQSTTGKQRNSVFKKFKNLFRKSSKTSPSSACHKHPLTSRQVSGSNVSNYYSNNTDGFEVILEGDRLQYEESPKKEPTSNQIKLCGTEQSCDPLVNWDSFINILAGNLNDFYHLFSGGEKESSVDTVRNGNQSYNVNPDIVESSEFNAHSTMGTSRRSLSFLQQGTGVQETAAIETTLEQGQAARSSLSQRNGHGMVEDERIEIHPYNRKNDAPISAGIANQSQSENFPPSFQSSKNTAPEEEIYDTSFTLNFLKVRSYCK